jgi:hypothetical protein
MHVAPLFLYREIYFRTFEADQIFLLCLKCERRIAECLVKCMICLYMCTKTLCNVRLYNSNPPFFIFYSPLLLSVGKGQN